MADSERGCVELTKFVRKKLERGIKRAENPSVGIVVGWYKEGTLLCIDCAYKTDQFPAGLNSVGVFFCSSTPLESEKELLQICKPKLAELYEVFSENAVVLYAYSTSFDENPSVTVVKAKMYSYYSCTFQDVEVLDAAETNSDGIILRARGHIPLLFEASPDKNLLQENLEAAVDKLKTVFHSNVPAFCLKNTQILFRSSSDEEDPASKIMCKDLYLDFLDDLIEIKNKKKKGEKIKEPLNFDILLQTTGDAALENTVNHTLVIHCQRRDFQCISMALPIDVIGVVQENDLASNICNLFVEAIQLQLEQMADCLVKFNKESEFLIPEPFHFYPDNCTFPITIIYPSEWSDAELELLRKTLHSDILLPMDRPLLRKTNRYFFSDELLADGYLKNTHIGLPSSGVQGGTVAIVDGTYTYYHYMQDHINDDGWGCAYRSLQTIISWFQHQGYTSNPVPTHKEIQQALADIGDKPSTFVGSKQWIGSQEVSFCLDKLIGVTSKILFVSSGAELANKGRELVNHFLSQRTPVMIGGGVLAHTIIGVDFNERTGDLRFLILDPHYTGSEDLTVIQNKGWCGWKKVQFWDQTVFYNMCLPQCPLMI